MSASFKPINKPSWLSRETFNDLLDRYAPLPHCKVCGCLEDLSVDHITPRWAGGTDELSNLQILCRPHNSSKGIREDVHWRQNFYWDQMPDATAVDNLRGAQKDLLEAIVISRPEYFSRPLSVIARRLYVCASVVGSGKTIAIAVAGWALNRVILAQWGTHARRVDRILVLTKDQAIRDQIATSLKEDLVNYRIANRAPVVEIVDKGSQWKQTTWLDESDIIVACVQQLWEANGAPRADLAKILAEFPLIAIDEPHFGHEQADRIVEAATSSVVIGFTGTPIDECGALLPKMVLLSLFDYADAVRIDRSLKYLDYDPERFGDFVREIDIHEAHIIEAGIRTITENARKKDYDKNIEPAKAVTRVVIEIVAESDRLQLANEKIAPHRRLELDAELALLYPMHTIVYCHDINQAEQLCDNTNKMFDDDRSSYPLEDGWRAVAVHSGNKTVPAKPLARQADQAPHPWMWAYHNRLKKLDENCARIMFCVGMAREGINNPYVGCTGIASGIDSIVYDVQGPLGRQMRAVIEFVGDHLLVPPAPLDQVRIVTHKTYNIKETLLQAFKFICDMRGHLAALPTIDDLEDADPLKPGPPIDGDLTVTKREKIEVVGIIDRAKTAGQPPPVDNLITTLAPNPGKRRERLKEWIDKVCKGNKAALRAELGFKGVLVPLTVVRRERIKHAPTDSELERFVHIQHPELIPRLPVTDQNRDLFQTMHSYYAARYQQPPLTPTTTINTLCRQLIGGNVLAILGQYYVIGGDTTRVWRRAVTATKIKFNIPKDEPLADRGDWDTPQIHALIHRPEVHHELVDWVIWRLIDEGHCPGLPSLVR